jgi:hypothetical protein
MDKKYVHENGLKFEVSIPQDGIEACLRILGVQKQYEEYLQQQSKIITVCNAQAAHQHRSLQVKGVGIYSMFGINLSQDERTAFFLGSNDRSTFPPNRAASHFIRQRLVRNTELTAIDVFDELCNLGLLRELPPPVKIEYEELETSEVEAIYF